MCRFGEALNINGTLKSLSFKGNPIKAPVCLWEKLSTFRTQPVLEIFGILTKMRRHRSDHNNFAVVIGWTDPSKKRFSMLAGVNDAASHRNRNGLLQLDRTAMDSIRDFLWCSRFIEANVTDRVRALFGQESDGKGAAKVLVWLRNEQAALEGGEASVTGKKRGLEDAAMTSDVSWSSMFKPFVLK